METNKRDQLKISLINANNDIEMTNRILEFMGMPEPKPVKTKNSVKIMMLLNTIWGKLH